MSEMTTQEMIGCLEKGGLFIVSIHRHEADAIAARLKALEEALRWYQQQCAELAIPVGVDSCEDVIEARAAVSDEAFMDLQLDGGNRARAILDKVREVEK